MDWCANVDAGEKEGEDSKFFAEAAKEMEVCILADLLWDEADPPRVERTMTEWRRRLVTPEAGNEEVLQGIYANSKSHYARDLAGTLMQDSRLRPSAASISTPRPTRNGYPSQPTQRCSPEAHSIREC